MTPENGGKFELRLDESSSDSATYVSHLQTAASSWRAAAHVGASAGSALVAFEAWATEQAAGEPPDWLVADARAALKAALRTGLSSGRWPRRITRWRPEPT